MNSSNKAQPLERLLQSQGFGSRKQCRQLICDGRVRVNGELCQQPERVWSGEGLQLTVDEHSWPWRAQLYLALHKPAGFECSRQPSHYPSVLTLLPAHFIARGVQPIGRLDADTSGLLLLTDDGALNHALSSPRRHIAKTYRVFCKHPLQAEQLQNLLDGVLLRDETEPLRALSAAQIDACTLDLQIDQGKYHQVKRMLAAVGNRVEQLHRLAMGSLRLDAPPLDQLQAGQWCELDEGLRKTALA